MIDALQLLVARFQHPYQGLQPGFVRNLDAVPYRKHQTAMKTYRYERKFLVEALDAHQAGRLVKRHPWMFYEPYPPRYVNNLYLDTHQLDNYTDNVSGTMNRRKVRIRWYGYLFEDIQEPVLEIKHKVGPVGYKIQHPLPPLGLQSGAARSNLKEYLRRADLPNPVYDNLVMLSPVLINRYHRRYFAARSGPFRITIDQEMAYFRTNRAAQTTKPAWRDHRHIIVEIKYSRGSEPEIDRVAGYFPFRMTRSSKYVTGVNKIYSHAAVW